MIKRVINKILKELRYRKYRKQLKNRDFTLISQNCIGGVIYHQLGINFLSPTVNMFIEDENFVKLVYDVKHYMSVEPKPLTDRYVDPIDNSVVYPKIKIDDIEICCLHYADCQDAIDAWKRRRDRVNYNNICVIANTWNLHNNMELIDKIAKAPYKTIIISTMDLPYDNCIVLEDDFWMIDSRSIIRPNITDDIPGSSYKYFEKFFNYVEWINNYY